MCRRGSSEAPGGRAPSLQHGAHQQSLSCRWRSGLCVKHDQAWDHLAGVHAERKGEQLIPGIAHCPSLGEPQMFLVHSRVFIYSSIHLKWLQSSLIESSLGFSANKMGWWGQELRGRFSVFTSCSPPPHTHTVVEFDLRFFHIRMLNYSRKRNSGIRRLTDGRGKGENGWRGEGIKRYK